MTACRRATSHNRYNYRLRPNLKLQRLFPSGAVAAAAAVAVAGAAASKQLHEHKKRDQGGGQEKSDGVPSYPLSQSTAGEAGPAVEAPSRPTNRCALHPQPHG